MALHFSKYEGLGNDFILLDGSLAASVGPEEARTLCDRHFGIGADGVLLCGVQDGRPFMRVINADGSRPEMCGNGLRCAALYLSHQGHVEGTSFQVETDAGLLVCELQAEGQSGQVEVAMTPASLDASGVLREPPSGGEPALDVDFEVQGHLLRGSAISMGNPHFVLFDVPEWQQDALGPPMSVDSRFVAGANIGFAQMLGEAEMRLRVHERGAGWTLACGTGACAAVAAAVETGRVERGTPVTVHLPGGPLRIVVAERGEPIRMQGPARRVFEGQLAGALEART